MLVSSSTVGMNKPKPSDLTGKENRSRSDFPGMLHPKNFVRVNTIWNKDGEKVQTQKK